MTGTGIMEIKNINFSYFSHKRHLRKAGPTGLSEIFDLDHTNWAPARRRRKGWVVRINKCSDIKTNVIFILNVFSKISMKSIAKR